MGCVSDFLELISSNVAVLFGAHSQEFQLHREEHVLDAQVRWSRGGIKDADGGTIGETHVLDVQLVARG